jgi:hypothetical protein
MKKQQEIILSEKLSFLCYDSDDNYNTIMKEQCIIERELQVINEHIFVAGHEKRDIGASIPGTIFILSDNSIQYFVHINEMIKNKFGSAKYSCEKSVERIPYSKANLSISKGERETIIIKRKSFLNLLPYMHFKVIIIVILMILMIYTIYLLYYSIKDI